MRRHFAVPEAELRRNLAGFPFVRVYRGWIVVDDYNFRQFPGANAAVNGLLETMKPACADAGQAGRFLIRK